jgi:nicotinamide mononucleotide transporter
VYGIEGARPQALIALNAPSSSEALLSGLEYVAWSLAVLNIVLLVRRSIWNYPFGIATVTLYGIVFLRARLYSDAILQIYFVVVQVYGWWNWVRGRNEDGIVRVETMSGSERGLFAALTLAVAVILGWTFATYSNAAAPWMDASLAAISVTAQYLLSIRKIENWILWIAADVVYIGLYWWKHLYATSILYAIFLALSIVGLVEWQRQLKRGGDGLALQEVQP